MSASAAPASAVSPPDARTVGVSAAAAAAPIAPVAIVLKGYPRLSETFIANEIRALEERGFDLRIVSLRHPTDRIRHPVHEEIRAPVLYLPEYLWREPARIWRGWRAARRLAGWRAARRLWLRDLIRDPTPNRVRRFGQALVLACELPREVAHLHAHFLHTPASVARYAARLRGLAWSGSAHAVDVWTAPEWEQREKIADCVWLAACSGPAHRHLEALAPPGSGRVALIPHGLDRRRFPSPSPARTCCSGGASGDRPGGGADSDRFDGLDHFPDRPDANRFGADSDRFDGLDHDGGGRDGSDPADPLVVLCVGRAVPKKGHDVLLAALALLPPGLHWRLVHIGGGPLTEQLRRQAEAAGIGERIDWRGACPQDAVLEAYRGADLFVLASRILADGNRDGLPNVLLEAMSQGLACVATAVSAIPDLVEDGVTGRLAPAEDPRALAAAIEALARDPATRRRLAAAAERRIDGEYGFVAGIDAIAARLAACLPAAAAAGEGAAAGKGTAAGEGAKMGTENGTTGSPARAAPEASSARAAARRRRAAA